MKKIISDPQHWYRLLLLLRFSPFIMKDKVTCGPHLNFWAATYFLLKHQSLLFAGGLLERYSLEIHEMGTSYYLCFLVQGFLLIWYAGTIKCRRNQNKPYI